MPRSPSPARRKGPGWGSYSQPKYLSLQTPAENTPLDQNRRGPTSLDAHSSQELGHEIGFFKLLFLSKIFTDLTPNRLRHFCDRSECTLKSDGMSPAAPGCPCSREASAARQADPREGAWEGQSPTRNQKDRTTATAKRPRNELSAWARPSEEKRGWVEVYVVFEEQYSRSQVKPRA